MEAQQGVTAGESGGAATGGDTGTGGGARGVSCTARAAAVAECLSLLLLAVGVLLIQSAAGQVLRSALPDWVTQLRGEWGGPWHQAARLAASLVDVAFLLPLLVIALAWRMQVPALAFLKWATRPRVSRFAVMLVLYNLLGFGALVVYQLNTTWYFSTSNLALGPDPGLNSTSAGGAASGDTTDIAAQPAMIDWSRIVTLVVHAPLAEELVFRAGMFYVALSRCKDVVWCAAVSSGLFACVHLLNAMSNKFDNSYVMLQALAGFVVGCCYCMRLAVTGSVFECFVLHLVNNALACLVPADGTISFADTSKLLPLVHTFAVYMVCCALSVMQLRRTTFFQFAKRHPILFPRLAHGGPDAPGGAEATATGHGATDTIPGGTTDAGDHGSGTAAVSGLGSDAMASTRTSDASEATTTDVDVRSGGSQEQGPARRRRGAGHGVLNTHAGQ